MKYFLIAIFIIIGFTSQAQKNEISISNSIVYLDNKPGYAIDVHYIRDKKDDRLWRGNYKLGFGIENVFNNQIKHNSFGLIIGYNIKESFICISPRIIFDENNFSYGFHLEGGYEFEVGHFCLSPMIHLSIEPSEYHVGAGLHLGYAF